MPGIDFRLQTVAHGEQFAVPGAEIAQDRGEPGPERVGGNSGFGRGFVRDEIEQNRSDFQSVGIDTLHDGNFSRELRSKRGFQGQATKRPDGGPCSGPF